MSITRATRRALGDAFPSISPGVETDKFGFPLHIDTPHEGWKIVLEEYIPLFDAVGWLDGFDSMNISNGGVIGIGNLGNYSNCAINIEHELVGDHQFISSCGIVELSKRFVLTHEMIHHAHLYINEYEKGSKELSTVDKARLKARVSNYASTNSTEAVAEIGAGIALGYDFPNKVHQIYKEHDGPKGVYDIRTMRE